MCILKTIKRPSKDRPLRSHPHHFPALRLLTIFWRSSHCSLALFNAVIRLFTRRCEWSHNHVSGEVSQATPFKTGYSGSLYSSPSPYSNAQPHTFSKAFSSYNHLRLNFYGAFLGFQGNLTCETYWYFSEHSHLLSCLEGSWVVSGYLRAIKKRETLLSERFSLF